MTRSDQRGPVQTNADTAKPFLVAMMLHLYLETLLAPNVAIEIRCELGPGPHGRLRRLCSLRMLGGNVTGSPLRATRWLARLATSQGLLGLPAQ